MFRAAVSCTRNHNHTQALTVQGKLTGPTKIQTSNWQDASLNSMPEQNTSGLELYQQLVHPTTTEYKGTGNNITTSIDNMQHITEGQPLNPIIYQRQKGSINIKGVVPVTRTNNTGNTQATVPANNTKERQQRTTPQDQISPVSVPISSTQKSQKQQGQIGGWYQKLEPRITHSHSKPDRYELIPRPCQRIGGSQG
jgi:hypothetical protein